MAVWKANVVTATIISVSDSWVDGEEVKSEVINYYLCKTNKGGKSIHNICT